MLSKGDQRMGMHTTQLHMHTNGKAHMCCAILRYGQQLVPLDDDGLLHYKPGKCMELLGFTDKENIPRW